MIDTKQLSGINQKTKITIDFVEDELMELLLTMYPNAFYNCNKGTSNYSRRCALWQMQLSRTDLAKEDIIQAVYYLNLNTDSDRLPSIARVIERAKIEKRIRLNKSGTSAARIITPEEVRAKYYLELIKKEDKNDEDFRLLEILKYDAELFYGDGHEERYTRHFGKPREEFERI